MIIPEIKIEKDLRFQNFVIFDPASQRISETDIIARGYKVKEIFEEVIFVLSKGKNLQDLIIQNRLIKIEKMLDLVSDYNGVIMTRFFDRIWRRYAHLSHLGETFLDMKTFLKVYPEYQDNKLDVIAHRIYDEEDIKEESLQLA